MSSTSKFKVESGIQLLARLRRKPELTNFYTVLFENGLKHGEVTEIFSNESISHLIIDIISEALIPASLSGLEAGVLVFNTDGNFNFEAFVISLRRKLWQQLQCLSPKYTDEELDNVLRETLRNLHILDIYDATQFYTTLHNLDTILVENKNISLIIFDTLTAFYWSEQGFKITKMDFYLKTLLRMIQKITKEFNVTVAYTRPGFFSSCKDSIENLEPCCEYPTFECINYRIQILPQEDRSYQVIVRTFNTIQKKYFTLSENEITWL